MPDIIELKSGRFKGVDFLFTEAETTGGNRILKFNYPGSNKQAVERQGEAPRSYALTIWIPHENYYNDRDELVRVLSDGEVGTLTHPTWGDVNNITCGLWRLSEKLTELGRGSISVTFEVDDSLGVPQLSGALSSQVQAEAEALNQQLSADVSGGFEVDTDLAGVVSGALDATGAAVEAIGSAAVAVASPLTEAAATFRASVVRVTSAIGDLIYAPQQLAEELDGLYADLNNLYPAPEDALLAFRALFGYDEGDDVEPTTVARQQRKNNQGLLQANVNCYALSYAYVNAAEATYLTTNELDNVQAVLEAQYVLVRQNEAISNASLERLDRVRVQAQKTLDLSRVNTRTIITIETRRMPLSVLVYSYYGSTELVDTIAELNNIKQNAFVEGALRVLTA